jgi:TRAP-type C4-dicarboxylate transport system substrate-binding protein
VLVSKKWWDGLSKDEKAVLTNAAKTSRDFERKDTRAEATQALQELKTKGMQVNVLPAAEADRMRDKLTRINASIAANVGMELWQETQATLQKLRAKK